MLMALLVLSQVAYATGYYGERSRARRARANGVRPVMQPDLRHDLRHDLIEARVTGETQAQPRPVTSA
jgi:hypothetical protein